MDDGTVAALEYEREGRRYSVELFTSFDRGDTYCIVWKKSPKSFLLENRTGASHAAGHICHVEHRFKGALCMKNICSSVFLEA